MSSARHYAVNVAAAYQLAVATLRAPDLSEEDRERATRLAEEAEAELRRLGEPIPVTR